MEGLTCRARHVRLILYVGVIYVMLMHVMIRHSMARHVRVM
jgi:hypothetical protein